MSKFSHIRQTILDLNSKEKRSTSIEILDFYWEKAKTIADYDLLGELAVKTEHRELYLRCAEAAHAAAENDEQLFAARTNLYKAYNAMNYPEKALFYIDLNLEMKPNDFDLLMNRAFNWALQGKREEADALIQSLIDNETDNSEDIRYALSGKMLRDGDTANGILNFIDTFKPKNVLFEEHYNMHKWTGGSFPGKTLYINGEGGIGDEIINIRFMDNIKKLGMKPVLYSSWSMYRPDIVDIFRRHGHEVITDYYSIRETEMWTHMMSLPGYLNLTEKDLWTGKYLHALRDPKNKIESTKVKVGIKRSGNPFFAQDEYRKIDLDLMMKYIPESCEVYYIDKDKVNHPRVNNLADRIETWEDTLDFIEEMDIIVSSCTSLVHAAGALGKKTIVIVPIAEYYTWTSTRTNNTTPWYGDNFTVLKQSKVRSWDEPLAEMNTILRNFIDEF